MLMTLAEKVILQIRYWGMKMRMNIVRSVG